MTEVPKEIIDKALEAIEVAKATGKIKKGTNEVTKTIERGTAKLVAIAKDVTPPEIVMHIPLLAEEKGIPCITVATREELGASAGISVSTASVSVIQEGQAKALIKEITGAIVKKPAKEEKPEAEEEKPKEEKKPAKEEKAKEKKPAKEEKSE